MTFFDYFIYCSYHCFNQSQSFILFLIMSALQACNSVWQRQQPPPFPFGHTKPIRISDNKFIIINEIMHSQRKKIRIAEFIERKNEWNRIILKNNTSDHEFICNDNLCFNQIWRCNSNLISYNEIRGIVYVFDNYYNLWSIVINDTKSCVIDHHCLDQILIDNNFSFFPRHCALIKNNMVLFSKDSPDIIIDMDKLYEGEVVFKCASSSIHVTEKVDIVDIRYTCWIEKLKKLIAFCIVYDDDNFGKFSVCEYSLRKHNFVNSFCINGMVPSELTEPQFNKAAFALNSNQDYLFIFGEGSIIIFDFNKFTFFRSATKFETNKCNNNHGLDAVCTSNRLQSNLIVYGFVRDFYNNRSTKDISFLPCYLIDLILKSFCIEHIHLMYKNQSGPHHHIKISIDQLLCNNNLN